MTDTGRNVAESLETLRRQQSALKRGHRAVQMFPVGTPELPLPDGLYRIENHRGVFHYNPQKITAQSILKLSAQERENELLGLGPFSKREIVERVMAGERALTVMEIAPDGTEIKSAVGTTTTAAAQAEYLEKTREPENEIIFVQFPPRVVNKLRTA